MRPRKAPAVKARAPKLVKQEVSEPSRDVNKIEVLVSRWKWLEADQDYQTAIAPRGRDADLRYDVEQERIIAELRTLVPQDYYELAALFRFTIDGIRIGVTLRCDGADFDILSNIYDALPGVFRDERKTALQEGMKNMREFLNKRTGAVFDVASDPEIIERIGWGNA
jgi:hypothetical protein